MEVEQLNTSAANPATDSVEQIKKKHKFKITEYTSHATWSYSISLEQCGICRNSVNEPSIQYTAASNDASKGDETGLSLCIGGCQHGYHLDCIQRWCKQRPVCPLCNNEWNWESCSIEKIQGFSNS